MIPDNYLVIDLETNGLGRRAHIVQFGWASIEGRKLKSSGAVMIRLPTGASMSPGAQDVHNLSIEKLAAEGKDPKETIAAIHEFVSESSDIAGHNIIRFDSRILNENFLRYGLPTIDFQDKASVIDTGGLYKARQIAKQKLGNHFMRASETLYSYEKRIVNRRLSIKWNLNLCASTLNAGEVRGHHDAEEDCQYVYRILEAMRERGWFEELLC